MTESPEQRRNRRLTAKVRKAELEMNAEVKAFMDKGMSFDEAWIAAGGLIIPLASVCERDNDGTLVVKPEFRR